ncbi:MAG: hypothetical protein ACP6IQ_03710 [Candidatus Njordarchaeia archaeon]
MIPDVFKKYFFYERRKLIEKMLTGEAVENNELYLQFTRALPAIVSNGPEGLNASIKMVGFVPKEEYLTDTINKIKDLVAKKVKGKKVIEFLLNEIYVEEKIDFTKIGTLDLAKKRTWGNLKNGGEAVLIFFTPVETSFMIKAKVKTFTDGPYYQYMNLLHDIFHVGPVIRKKGNPTYIFEIEEIWDKSLNAFGKKIYP